MKHEEKVATATGLGFGLLAFGFAAIVANPVVLGAAAVGTYRMAKMAYDKAKKPQQLTDKERENLYL